MPVPSRADLFGVPLEEIMGYNGEKGSIPRVVRDSILFLRARGMSFFSLIIAVPLLTLLGLEEEGLFRRSASEAMIKQVKSAYDRGM